MDQTFMLTDTTRITVEPCEDTEDPRTWDTEVDCLQYGVPYLDSPDDLGDCQTTLGSVFTVVWGNHGDDRLALKVAERYKRMFDVKESIAIEQIIGYSQGDWAHVVCVTPEGHGDPDGHIKTFRNWRFGCVYTVTVERRAQFARITPNDHGTYDVDYGETYSRWEDVESLSGVYPDDEWIELAEALRTVIDMGIDWTEDEARAISDQLAARGEHAALTRFASQWPEEQP